MSSSTSLRTVWLTLRATNYTTAAMTGCLRSLDQMQLNQKNLAMTQIELGKSALMAGTMFQVLGSQMGGVGGQVLSTMGTFMQFAGVASMAMGVISKLSSVNWAATISNDALNASFKDLAVSIGLAFALFMVAEEIFSRLPPICGIVAAAVLALATALILLQSTNILSAATLIPALALGGAAVGAMYGAYQSATGGASFQMGTRMAGFTGPAILHKGEVVYNPATGRPTQVGNDLASGGGGMTTIDASMHVETLNTKADTEELNFLLKKQGRTIAQNNR